MFYPIVYNFQNSLFEWSGVGSQKLFIGLRNFENLFIDPVFKTILVNLVIFSVVTIFVQAFLGLLLAVLLQKSFSGRDAVKAVLFMPAVFSAVVVGNIFFRICDPNTGMINAFLRSIGLKNFTLSLIGDPHLALWTIIAVQIWQWTGYSMTMYYAGIQEIPSEIYEAAQIDGAKPWTMLTRITLPMLQGTTYGLTILGFIGTLKQFDLAYTMTKGGPANSTQFFSIYIYQVTFGQFKQGYACALSVCMFIIALAVTVFQLKLYNRGKVEN